VGQPRRRGRTSIPEQVVVMAGEFPRYHHAGI